jgi:hypothetical protein
VSAPSAGLAGSARAGAHKGQLGARKAVADGAQDVDGLVVGPVEVLEDDDVRPEHGQLVEGTKHSLPEGKGGPRAAGRFVLGTGQGL